MYGSENFIRGAIRNPVSEKLLPWSFGIDVWCCFEKAITADLEAMKEIGLGELI